MGTEVRQCAFGLSVRSTRQSVSQSIAPPVGKTAWVALKLPPTPSFPVRPVGLFLAPPLLRPR